MEISSIAPIICVYEEVYSLRENRPLRNLNVWKERYCKGDEKDTFTRPFLMLGNIAFDKHVDVWERYCKGDL